MDRSFNTKFSPYLYGRLPPTQFFRILKLLPGSGNDQVSCVLLETSWPTKHKYEALSYAWGDPSTNQTILCDGKNLGVTTSLHGALVHLRQPTRPRLLWADAVCIDQSNLVERAEQVKQMKSIYESAQSVLVWLGPDKDAQAKLAVDSIVTISNFLCNKLAIKLSDLSSFKDIYQDVIFRNRATLPVPSSCHFSSAKVWASLKWLYSHKYFTRVWVIQEINAQTARSVHCGTHEVEWTRVELVAGYIIMDSAFSKSFGSSTTHCWWAAIVSTERIRQPNNWLFMLYLASNFSGTDARDAIYGVLGLLTVPSGRGLLEPNYNKSVVEVYRDSVEAALHQFKNTDVLLYVKEDRIPSWVPSWNKPMLFRNPFRFGKALPWAPAGSTKPEWRINKANNTLSLEGLILDKVHASAAYNESCFGNARLDSAAERTAMGPVWDRILRVSAQGGGQALLTAERLTAVAVAFSYGVDDSSSPPAVETVLLRNFMAYLSLVLGTTRLQNQVQPGLVRRLSDGGDARLFGKPVWDFQYPNSSFFVTRDEGRPGCCIAPTAPGDVVFAPFGSTYPLVLRLRGEPSGGGFNVCGYAFVHGVMRGESQRGKTRTTVVLH